MSDLVAPFPYFGGKRSIAADVWRLASGALLTHEQAVSDAFSFLVARVVGRSTMARLAPSLSAINVSSIGIKFRARFNFAATSAAFRRDAPTASEFVLRVFRRCVPAQVFKPVVPWVRIRKMASMMGWRRWRSDKGKKHQAVNLTRYHASVYVEGERAVTIAPGVDLHLAWRSDASGPAIVSSFSFNRPNPAICGREITWISWDRTQFVFHSLLIHTTTCPSKELTRYG